VSLRSATLTFLAIVLVKTTLAAAMPVAASCDGLGSLSIQNTTITLAQSVGAGAFTPVPGGQQQANSQYQQLPPFCRVAATLTPSSDSDIKIEVWMPSAGWNGKYLAVGNGGWAGSINYNGMADALQRGYATSSTNTGHAGGSAVFAAGHPEKLIDFGHRAVHAMTVASKAVITSFYENSPRYSYWNGCSAGGGQGLREAWRYPEDFDGVVAGAISSPVMLDLASWWIWVAQAMHRTDQSYIPQSKYPLLHSAAIQSCDAADGLKDGLIQDPSRCRFDPVILQCKADDAPDSSRRKVATSNLPRPRRITSPRSYCSSPPCVSRMTTRAPMATFARSHFSTAASDWS
jgi:feruloyl esterase